MVALSDLRSLRRPPTGGAIGGASSSLDANYEDRDPRLDNFRAELPEYQGDLGGEFLREETGYRVPVLSELGNAVNAYLYGMRLNEYREEIKKELDAQLESEGIEVGSSEYWKEYTERMPEVGSAEALAELGIGATAGVPVAKGAKLGFGALKSLFNKLPKDTPQSLKVDTSEEAKPIYEDLK
jgi:hypothetical protein